MNLWSRQLPQRERRAKWPGHAKMKRQLSKKIKIHSMILVRTYQNNDGKPYPVESERAVGEC